MTEVVAVDGEDGAVRREGDVTSDYVDVGEGVEMLGEKGLGYRVGRARVEHGGYHCDGGSERDEVKRWWKGKRECLEGWGGWGARLG